MSSTSQAAVHAPAQPLLDHIVILVDHHALLGIDNRLDGIFRIAPGGQHAGGLTWNRLILFEDGVYIELIAFLDTVDPEVRRKHRWGSLPDGTIIDWACSLKSEREFGQIQKRVQDTETGYTYHEPVPGGRQRPDGTVLKWAIGSALDPDGGPTAPGTLPFWCLDRTPRNLRVPYESSPELTSHPLGVKGISRIVLEAPQGDVAQLQAVYDAVFRGSGGSTADGWHFDVPARDPTGRQSISITPGGEGQVIKLALTGNAASPSFVELLPGLVVKIDK